MADWYMKGQSNYDNATGFHMGLYLDVNGFPEANYDAQRMPYNVENQDPFMAFGAKTASWLLGQKQVEFGLWDDYRVRIDSSGIWGYNAGTGVWMNLMEGGGDDLGNHTATIDLSMGSNDITFTGGSFEYGQSVPAGTDIMGWNGYFYATRVYNAVYNDYADYWKLEIGVEKIPGYCYSFNKRGLIITNKRADKACMGICSDTYGFGVGQQHHGVPISIGGFLLAHVDKEYKPGDLLVPSNKGILTKARYYERRKAIAKYMYKETKTKTRGVWVKNRYWVKVL